LSALSGGPSGLLDGAAKPRSWLADPYMVVVCIAAAKLVLHLYSGRRYGLSFAKMSSGRDPFAISNIPKLGNPAPLAWLIRM